MQAQRSILLVEDDPAMRDILKLVFSQQFQAEYQILSTDNGFDALETVKRFKPELVILDILLPQMNGLQLIQKLQAAQLLEYTRIIIISALGFREIVQQALEAGASDFLVKPFKLEALVERSKSILL
jgi:DNA-binding response OmpR family regulator